ncbi:DUF4239 domain-containing protein [Roseimicrobium gellanilyticum]|nr:DUF4239 domain-containing protein [Roseimicrobium gellanilyticum]
MSIIATGILFVCFLFAGILLCIELGKRLGKARFSKEGESATTGISAIEGAVFGLLGLTLAFLFSGALSRFDERRKIITQECNDIGTAWLRVDLLPVDTQPAMRDLFRRYLDSRIETYRKLPDLDAAKVELQRSAELQSKIWTLAVSSTQGTGTSHPPMLLLPALNSMFDTATLRTEASKMHPPIVITAMLAVLALASSLFAGYDMANRRPWLSLHPIAFALVLSVTVYVIIDLEYPHLGMIQVKNSEEILIGLRDSMNTK